MSTPRNAPCPCGSGKKYKRCCIDQKEISRHSHEHVHGEDCCHHDHDHDHQHPETKKTK